MSDEEPVIAVGLLTAREVSIYGDKLRSIYSIADADHFSELLLAIDDADRTLRLRRDAKMKVKL